MLREVQEALDPKPGEIIVDGTMGGGGHTRLLAGLVVPGGRLIGIDRDLQAVERVLADRSGLPIEAYHANYIHLSDLLQQVGIAAVDGILLDLGLSSDQLADEDRGFSYQSTGLLDMRFDRESGTPAWQWLAEVSEKDLADTIYRYSEERQSRRIAREIVESRKQQPIKTAAQLVSILNHCVRRSKGHAIHPATRTFQAIRIAVNDELRGLEIALAKLPDCLRPGGRIAIISFHSLEDRIVKHAFRDDPRLTVITKKPLQPSTSEIRKNKRSRSSKLRVAVRNSL
jgi:16S rRNA (cytosine1402-N4)-methyltransferase